MNATIRKATLTDKADLGKIYCAAWKEAYKNILPSEYLEKLNEEFCTPKTDNLENYLVAEMNNTVAGLVNYGVSRDSASEKTGEIRAIYILPEFWRIGLGTELFRAAQAEMKKHGYISAYLWVLEKNIRAVKFYEKMQMRTTKEKRTIQLNGTQLTKIKYECEL